MILYGELESLLASDAAAENDSLLGKAAISLEAESLLPPRGGEDGDSFQRCAGNI